MKLSSDRGRLLTQDGKFIRYLFCSEQAGISILDTFHHGYADEHVQEVVYDEEEVQRRLAWLRERNLPCDYYTE